MRSTRSRKKFGVPLYETPVGFKYIGEKLLAGEIGFGGEESAGLTIEGHVPEKDGILADLLDRRARRAPRSARSAQLRARLWDEIGPFLTRRIDLPLSPEEKERLARAPREPAVDASRGAASRRSIRWTESS